MASWLCDSSSKISRAQFCGEQPGIAQDSQRYQASVAIEDRVPPCCSWSHYEELRRTYSVAVDIHSEADDLISLVRDESLQRRTLVRDGTVARVLTIEIEFGKRDFLAVHS